MEDMLEMDGDDEIEDEADAEVDKVLFELTNGKLGEAGSVGTGLPVRSISCSYVCPSLPTFQSLRAKVEDEETERTMEKYREQLNGLLT